MSETTATTPDSQEPAAAAPAAPKPTPPSSAPAPDAPASPDISGWMDGKTPELTVENAAKVIAAIRADYKAERARLRDGGQSAAEKARADLAQEIGRAIGLVKADEPADPAALTKQLATTAAEAQQAKVALAVFRVADSAGADPVALLDSATFLAKAGDLNPADTDAIAAAIADAVAANPRLAAATTAVTPGMKPNPAQGRSASPTQTLAERIAAAQEAGDVKTAMRLKASMALDPSSSF